MKNLFTLLQRFSQSLNHDALLKEKVSQVIESYTHLKIDPTNLNIKNGVLEIVASPVVKNEINLKETQIKEALNEVTRIVYRWVEEVVVNPDAQLLTPYSQLLKAGSSLGFAGTGPRGLSLSTQ